MDFIQKLISGCSCLKFKKDAYWHIIQPNLSLVLSSYEGAKEHVSILMKRKWQRMQLAFPDQILQDASDLASLCLSFLDFLEL